MIDELQQGDFTRTLLHTETANELIKSINRLDTMRIEPLAAGEVQATEGNIVLKIKPQALSKKFPFQVFDVSRDNTAYLGVYKNSILAGVATEGAVAFQFEDYPLYDNTVSPIEGEIPVPDIGGYIAVQLEMNASTEVVKASIVALDGWTATTSAELAGDVPDYYKFVRFPLAAIIDWNDTTYDGFIITVGDNDTRKVVQVWQGGNINMAYGIKDGYLWLYPKGSGIYLNGV